MSKPIVVNVDPQLLKKGETYLVTTQGVTHKQLRNLRDILHREAPQCRFIVTNGHMKVETVKEWLAEHGES